MIKSMTGYGRYEIVTVEGKISVEMKAVNHRYLDLSIKMPRKFNPFEANIRAFLKEYIQRGKVDVFIFYEDYTDGNVSLRYNQTLAAEYLRTFDKMEKEFGIPYDISVSSLAKLPEVLSMEQAEDDEGKLWELISDALKITAEDFVKSRIAEGEKLESDLLEKLGHMEEMIVFIENYSPGIYEQYRRRLEDKVKDLLDGTAIEEGRIAAEVVIYAEKICVDEETVRLKSHLESTRKELMSGNCVGRKLDFIAQEMNREANTILSKANDIEISNKAIALKTDIEKVREQIQNIE